MVVDWMVVPKTNRGTVVATTANELTTFQSYTMYFNGKNFFQGQGQSTMRMLTVSCCSGKYIARGLCIKTGGFRFSCTTVQHENRLV